MTKTQLIDRMCEISGMSRKYAGTAVDALLKTISETLKHGETIVIPGFGTFSVKERPEHQARNPITGESIMVPAKKVPSFKPGKGLKEAVEPTTK